ncbi:zinc finger protein 85-like isoform X2 [Saccostrea cucullata]|uniref:zinc finger protein 85-like isoform X2 n=1 Tax=Saccostrea cuccullata TaxID=36930 RepID=UPI002ED46734
MNNLGIQQDSQTTFNTNNPGMFQLPEPNVNTEKALNTTARRHSSTDAVANTNGMNHAMVSNQSILINLNSSVQNGVTLNQLVNNKTLPGNNSKTLLPADVEVTEQRFSVILQPVQKGDPPPVPNLDPPPVPNLDPSPQLENVQVKIEESSDVDEAQPSISIKEEESVENCLVAKAQKEDLTDSRSKGKMNETGFKFYKCGICDEAFCDSLDLEKHIRQHNILTVQSETIKCGYCEEIFFSKIYALHHLMCIHGIDCKKPKDGMEEVNLPTYESDENSVKTLRVIRTKIPKCWICGIVLPNLERYEKHKKNSSCAFVWYCCVSCGKQVGKKTLKEVPLPEELLCNQCHQSGNKPKEKAATMMEQEKQGSEMILGPVQPSIVGSGCKKCGKNKQSKQGNQRNQSKQGNQRNQSKQGNQRNQSKQGNQRNKINLDGGSHFASCDSKIAKLYKCDQCERAYMYYSSLRHHKLTHSKETFACDKCPKIFKLREVFKRHQNVHEPPKFQCDVCGRKLRSKQKLIEHKRIHSGEKPFLCEICGRGFHSRMARFFHMYSHDPSRKSLCEICGKFYTGTSSLRLHQIRHKTRSSLSMEEKLCILPWVCNICGKGFCKRLRYEKHKLNVHGQEREKKSVHLKKKKPVGLIICYICGKSLSRSSLSAHIAHHKGLMWTACEKCNMVMHKRSLRRHMLRMHHTTFTNE